jgi:hypothetical protein
MGSVSSWKIPPTDNIIIDKGYSECYQITIDNQNLFFESKVAIKPGGEEHPLSRDF